MKDDSSNVSVLPNCKWKIEAERAYVHITYTKHREDEILYERQPHSSRSKHSFLSLKLC